MRLRTNAVCILAHAHFFHAYIHRCRHIVALTGIHGTERRHVHQRFSGTAGIDNLLYQTLLKADSQKVRGKISRKETPVRRGIDAYFLAVVIKILGRKSAGTVFTHERLHQFVIPLPQAAIQHLVQGSIRLVEADEHFVHLPAQSMRRIAYQRIEILLQVYKKLRYIQEMLILAAMQAVDIFHQIRHTVCLKHGRGILRH